MGEDRSAHDALHHVDLSWVVTGGYHSASQRAETRLARAGQNAGPSRPAHRARPAEADRLEGLQGRPRRNLRGHRAPSRELSVLQRLWLHRPRGLVMMIRQPQLSVGLNR